MQFFYREQRKGLINVAYFFIVFRKLFPSSYNFKYKI